jgi:hypothetical protein
VKGKPKYDEATKRRALRRADEVGPTRAAEEFGVPVGTIKWWRHEAGQVDPPRGADPDDWASKKERVAQAQFSTAVSALSEVRRLLAAGDTRAAKESALVMAICVDKAGTLEEAAVRAQGRNVQLAEDQAKLIAAVIEDTLRALGIEPTQAMKKVVAHFMRQAATGDALSPPGEEAEEAMRDIRRQWGVNLDDHAPQLGRGDGGPPGLPREATDAEAGDLLEPRRVVRTYDAE